MSIFILTFYYSVLFISIVGFGSWFIRILDLKIHSSDYFLLGIFGVIVLTFISFVSNLFLPHNFFHNLLTHLIGIFLFFNYKIFPILYKKKYQQILLVTFFFASFLLFSLISKTHDDFGWYHLPYTLNLAQNKLQIGLGHFSHGFRTHSSIFYINSLFYLPIIKHFSFNFAQVFIFMFSIFYFFQKFEFWKGKNNIISIYSLLSLLFCLIIFYRLSEHGTDRSGQILVFIGVIIIFEIFNCKNDEEFVNKFFLLLILIVYIFTLKSYFIIFGILFIPILPKIFKKKLLFKKILFSKVSLFVLSLFLINYLTQFFNSGCFLYPKLFSCNTNLTWSFSKDEILNMNTWYELWSKGGANPNWRTNDVENYLKEFNWINNWFTNYFFNKGLDFIGGVISIILFVFLFIRKNLKKSKFKKDNDFTKFLFCFLVLFLIWFTGFPQLRYSGYTIIANILFLLFCYLISDKKLDLIKDKKIIYLITLSFIIFFTRNVDRIINENKIYGYNIFKNAYYKIENHNFQQINIGKNINMNKVEGTCWAIKQPCSHRSGIKGIKFKGYTIYFQ